MLVRAILDPSQFKCVCAWCGVVIAEGTTNEVISHGICPLCALNHFGIPISDIVRPEERPRTRPIRKLFSSLALLLLAISPLHGQVTAVADMYNRVTEVRVMNRSTAPLRAVLSIFRDATTPTSPVTLGDSVHALISPSAFMLLPGQVQTVRIMVRDSVSAGELLRLSSLLTPVDTSTAPGMRLVVATQLITKIQNRRTP
jgi:hypothetical protein